MKKLSMMLIATLASVLPAAAQQKTLDCNDHNGGNRLVRHCEMREQTIGFAGRLSIDGGTNGGVTVKAWDNGGVLVRAKVEAQAADQGTAQALASQIRLNLSAGQVTALGPEQNRDQNWAVSYEIFVPRQADLSIKTNNGGITISDVRGAIQFEAQNGGVTLNRLAGDVEGHTQNGGLHIELAGSRWDGAKLDARTTNGGVNISMPENYSAHLETATVNGHLDIVMPMTVRGEIGRRLSTDLGAGGPTIHVETTNGGVKIGRVL